MNDYSADAGRSGRATSSALLVGFRFLAWLNGLALASVLACAMGVIETELPVQYLKLPVAAFLSGLALAGLGLLWAFIVQVNLDRPLNEARRKRAHWLPLFCTVLAYSLSMAAFAVGCWFLVNLGAYVSQVQDFMPQIPHGLPYGR